MSECRHSPDKVCDRCEPPFDPAQPAPPQPTYRPREWETETKDKP